MSSIIKQRRKGTDTVYVYRSESVEVPGGGRRNKRTLIGKLDPVSGEIVPTGKRGGRRSAPSLTEPVEASVSPAAAPDVPGDGPERTLPSLADAADRSRQMAENLDALEKEKAMLQEELAQLKAQLGRMEQCLQDLKDVVVGNLDLCLRTFQEEDTESEG